MDISQNCSETCGWIAGAMGAIALGSFGTPIKHISRQIQVDPLVLQTFKSIMCFITCWLVLLMGEEVRFTYWGILSGLFWVPGATAGVYAIQNAGLAISYGVWASLIVLTSFCWGIFVFHEKVKSLLGAFVGVTVMIAGLIGMARYSAPSKVSDRKEISQVADLSSQITEPLLSEADKLELRSVMTRDDESDGRNVVARRSKASLLNLKVPPPTSFTTVLRSAQSLENMNSVEVTPTSIANDGESMNEVQDLKTCKESDTIHVYGKTFLTRRELGILCAVINGIWGGMNMIPMHYARSQGIYGISYLISYGSGSMLVTVLIWIGLYLFYLKRNNFSHKDAMKALPSFHMPTLLVPGIMSGCLYSLGNFGAIIAISVLGQSVGFSCVQLSLLVSGCWGIFIFGEVQGSGRILKWLMASCMTISGIIMLGLQHKKTEV